MTGPRKPRRVKKVEEEEEEEDSHVAAVVKESSVARHLVRLFPSLVSNVSFLFAA